jgi:protein-tyrosine phosphatase
MMSTERGHGEIATTCTQQQQHVHHHHHHRNINDCIYTYAKKKKKKLELRERRTDEIERMSMMDYDATLALIKQSTCSAVIALMTLALT